MATIGLSSPRMLSPPNRSPLLSPLSSLPCSYPMKVSHSRLVHLINSALRSHNALYIWQVSCFSFVFSKICGMPSMCSTSTVIHPLLSCHPAPCVTHNSMPPIRDRVVGVVADNGIPVSYLSVRRACIHTSLFVSG